MTNNSTIDFYSLPPRQRVCYLRQAVRCLATSRRWQELERLLTSFSFLKAKITSGEIGSLIEEYKLALSVVPPDSGKYRTLDLIGEVLELDRSFLEDHPDCLLTCLWNRGYWHDNDVVNQHFHQEADSRFVVQTRKEVAPTKFSALVDRWLERSSPDGVPIAWGRSLRPPEITLGTSRPHPLSKHSDSVRAVVFSPSGKLVASAGNDRYISIWNIHAGKVVKCLGDLDLKVKAVAFSLDESEVIAGLRDGTIQRWNLVTGEMITHRPPFEIVLRWIGVSHDDVWIVVQDRSGKFYLWNRKDGAGHEVDTVVETVGKTFGQSGRRAVFSSWEDNPRRYVVCLQDVQTGKVYSTLYGHRDRIEDVALSEDGRIAVSGSFDKTLRIWDAVVGKELFCCSGHREWVFGVAVTRDGRFAASASKDNTIRIWDTQSGAELAVLFGHTHWVNSVDFSPDGRYVVSGASDTRVILWEWKKSNNAPQLQNHNAEIDRLSFSPLGTQVVTSTHHDGQAFIWSVSEGKIIRRIAEGKSLNAAFSSDGRLLVTGAWDGNIRIWKTQDWSLVHCFQAHQVQEDMGFALSPNASRMVTWGDWNDGSIKLWNLEAAQEVETWTSIFTNQAVFSPNSELIAAFARDRQIYLWESSKGRLQTKLNMGDDWIETHCLVFSSDSTQLAASFLSSVVIWNITTRQVQLKLDTGHQKILEMAFSRDGAYLLTVNAMQETQEWSTTMKSTPSTISGRLGLSAFVSNSPIVPLMVDQETQFRNRDGNMVLRLPIAPGLQTLSPDSQVWASAKRNHLYLFQLCYPPQEGRAPVPEGLSEIHKIGTGGSITETVSAQESGDPQLRTVLASLKRYRPSNSHHQAGGFVWQNNDYVCHEAICPICGTGAPFETADYRTELRVYFTGNPAHSLNRRIEAMRIKCGGPPVNTADEGCSICTVGTGDSSGLYLLSENHQSRWSLDTVIAYLRLIRSPFANHPSLIATNGPG